MTKAERYEAVDNATCVKDLHHINNRWIREAWYGRLVVTCGALKGLWRELVAEFRWQYLTWRP